MNKHIVFVRHPNSDTHPDPSAFHAYLDHTNVYRPDEHMDGWTLLQKEMGTPWVFDSEQDAIEEIHNGNWGDSAFAIAIPSHSIFLDF